MRPIAKSRYSSIEMYICNHLGGCDPLSCTDMYNDVPVSYDEVRRLSCSAQCAGGRVCGLRVYMRRAWSASSDAGQCRA